MSEVATAIWVIVVFIVMLNGCAAGVVGMLHAWRSKMGRGMRTLTAVVLTALLPSSMFIPSGFMDATMGTEGPLILGLAFGMVFALTLIVSLPGALIVARKLEQPGEEYRAFE